MSNTKDGFDELLSWIETQADVRLEESPEQVHVCLEASGGYQRPVARFLYERGLTVSIVNPLRTSAYAESQLNRSKTDKVDARLLARFCQREEPSPWEPTSSEQKSLKELTRGLEQLKKERDRLKNQMRQSENPTVTGSLESVLESINEQIDQFEEGDLRSPASTSMSRAPTPSPETETCWRRSRGLGRQPLRSCSRSSGITSALSAPVRRLHMPA